MSVDGITDRRFYNSHVPSGYNRGTDSQTTGKIIFLDTHDVEKSVERREPRKRMSTKKT